jgi:hypothetical protein
LFVVGILRFQKWFGVYILNFQIALCCRYFGLFLLGDFLGYFLKNWAIFLNLLVTLYWLVMGQLFAKMSAKN